MQEFLFQIETNEVSVGWSKQLIEALKGNGQSEIAKLLELSKCLYCCSDN